MSVAESTPRRFRLTTDWAFAGLLVLEGILLVAERFHWFAKGWGVLTTVALLILAGILAAIWFAYSLIRHRRFQFGIRSMLLLVAVIAVPCSWLPGEIERAAAQRQTVGDLTGLGAGVWCDFQADATGNPIQVAELPGPAWLCDMLGDDFFGNVTAVSFLRDRVVGPRMTYVVSSGRPRVSLDLSALAQIGGLTHLRLLELFGTNIADEGMSKLEKLKELRQLDLYLTDISDAGLAHIAGLTQLESLDLGDTNITDAGLANLRGMKALKTLDLSGTQITDAGLAQLETLPSLTELNLQDTKTTPEGVKKLKRALPRCWISR